MSLRYGARLMPDVVDKISSQQPDLTYAFIPITTNNNIGRSSHFDTIAYMGLSDIRYVAVFLAAVTCGYKVLLPSPRNSAWMNASLLEQTKCFHFLYAPEVEALVNPLLNEKPGLRIHKVHPIDQFIQPGAEYYPFEKEYEDAKWDPILVLHSSGSTGPPKPIQMNHATFAVGGDD
ncbi:hypothetical protein F4810DRAFT_714545 [Camillea tinctor]|nr:hypothetical protein F4810DRAFT_714545 [Camillea tinctor]